MAHPALSEATIPLPSGADAVAVLGQHDALLEVVEKELGASVTVRGGALVIRGTPDEVGAAVRVFDQILALARSGQSVTPADVRRALRNRPTPSDAGGITISGEVLLVTPTGKPIAPRTAGQRAYVEAIRTHDLTFAIGPAGTGKTYLAVAMAAVALRGRSVQRLILTRPAIEAGEKLGFLPGDIAAKVDPYLRPLYDALYEMVGPERVARLMERGVIEVVPLAFMRGRTLNDAFIILDEAQNTTREQMKMFLTRMGFGSKAVVTGDITQIDLPRDRTSGLVEAREIFKAIEGIAFVSLGEGDVVRHELVQTIVRAYERYEAMRAEPPSGIG
ncbi:MAG: PhoH family protein [Armatimonadota bacterium]|nr:PhoH family protein [Armatimonadota bacterium]MDR7519169.1 PhoH family protein [Armatimonadota bacterium]MDR7550947.1 PhoH family protein [Armatimonadota bacterium]